MQGPRKGETLNSQSLAAEGKEGFSSGGLVNRLARYGRAKANALQFAQYLEQVGETSLAGVLDQCGSYAVFRDYYTIGQVRLSRFCTCKKHLICPLCAIRRGAKALRVYLARVAELMAVYPDLRPYLVTQTIKNGPDLAERYMHLNRSVRAYHRQRLEANKGRRAEVEANKAIAAVWSYEVTNRGKGWHPHSHAVWLCFEAPDPRKLSQEWLDVTGDSMIVDARPIEADPDGSYVSGFCEVFKYAVKFSDLADSDRLAAFRELRGKRLQDSFGALRGLDVEPADSDQLLDDLPFIERLFVFSGGRYVERDQSKHAQEEKEASLTRRMEIYAEMGLTDDQILELLSQSQEPEQKVA